VLARYADRGLKVAPELLKICFEGITASKFLHICCGYPDVLE